VYEDELMQIEPESAPSKNNSFIYNSMNVNYN
jgi:hypothetical protein